MSWRPWKRCLRNTSFEIVTTSSCTALASTEPPNSLKSLKSVSSTSTLVNLTGSQSKSDPKASSDSLSKGSLPSSAFNPYQYPWSIHQLALEQPELLEDGVETRPPRRSQFPRYGHSLASTSDDRFVLFGGFVNEKPSNDVCIINPKDLTATSLDTTGDIPSPRSGHTGVMYKNCMIVWGGETRTDNHDLSASDRSVYLLDLATSRWHRVTVDGELSPEGRSGHVAGVVDAKMYIFGGQRGDGQILNDVWVIHLAKCDVDYTAKWYHLNPGVNSPRPPALVNAAWTKYKAALILFGGTDGEYHYSDVWVYNTGSRTWGKLRCDGYFPVPREGHGVAMVADMFYVFGGRAPDGTFLGDLVGFQISCRRWHTFRGLGPAPSARSEHTMISRKDQVYVLGGHRTGAMDASADESIPIIHILDADIWTDRVFQLPPPRGAPPRVAV
ncbi:unnamed protein product [Somion occarium]|uniref:Kelch repeat-containing protein n=1 Tax=Somion occarium TaxID=3059160 RepID=A0ABP1CKE7_9APHY